MIIDNLIMKHCKYEDFTHNPMTCFQVSDADTMIKYLEIIHSVGLFLLLSLMIFATYNDVLRIIR